MSSMDQLDFGVSVADFFGAPLHKVNQILLRMGLEPHPPEWLRGTSKLDALPRWSEAGEHVIPVHKSINPKGVGERLQWVVEELRGGWKVCEEGFVFEEVGEALHFKLRWS